MIGFIVNPTSGGGKGAKYWNIIEKACFDKEIQYKVAFTEREGHAIDLSEKFARDSDIAIVVAIGGDGTVHEVANGIFYIKKPLGYIPAGTGNDYARVMDIPLEPIDALNKIVNGKSQTIDIVDLRGRKYLNIAGIGFDGQVTLTSNQASYKKWLGKFSYILSVIRVLFTFKPTDVIITIDEVQHHLRDVWLMAVANVPYYGGGMKICPNANWTDGWLDICVVHHVGRLRLLTLFPLVFSGKHIYKEKYVKMLKGKKVSITSSKPLYIHADGEIVGQTPVDIEIEPQSFKIIN